MCSRCQVQYPENQIRKVGTVLLCLLCEITAETHIDLFKRAKVAPVEVVR